MHMRITAGQYKNFPIESPKNSTTHPMGDRERLGLFNILFSSFGPLDNGIEILDAFAGTGALGLEALSRGAAYVAFVENSPAALSALKTNLKYYKIPDTYYELLDFSVDDLEAKRPDLKEGFDLIFADPPYDKYDTKQIISLVKFLRPGGFLALSSPKGVDVTVLAKFGFLELKRMRVYAGAQISLFQKP